MKLVVDIGNTNIAVGIYNDGEWRNHLRLRTVADKTADEYRVLFSSIFAESDINPEEFEQIVISSVVPQLTGSFSEMIRRLSGKEPLVVGPGIKTGLRIRTDNPSEVGGDLVANAVAARSRAGRGKEAKNAIAVDFGTALTFTAVSAAGDMPGVVIAPGINAAADSLAAHTAQLPQVRLQPPENVLGKNSVQSIQSGLVYGYAGLVDALIERISKELGEPICVFATGGQASIIAPLVNTISEVDSWLTLDGLRIIGDLNG